MSSNKRTYKSGAEKRKERKRKLNNEKDIQQIHTFFRASTLTPVQTEPSSSKTETIYIDASADNLTTYEPASTLSPVHT